MFQDAYVRSLRESLSFPPAGRLSIVVAARLWRLWHVCTTAVCPSRCLSVCTRLYSSRSMYMHNATVHNIWAHIHRAAVSFSLAFSFTTNPPFCLLLFSIRTRAFRKLDLAQKRRKRSCFLSSRYAIFRENFSMKANFEARRDVNFSFLMGSVRLQG